MTKTIRANERKTMINKNERKRKFREEISSSTKPVGSLIETRGKKNLSQISLSIQLDVDDEEDEEYEEEAPEEGFVEHTDGPDSSTQDIYRAYRPKFPMAKEFVQSGEEKKVLFNRSFFF